MIALTALAASSAWAGAWTREQGSTYVKAGADVYQALSFQAPGEAAQSEGAYFGQQYSLYGEVGLTKGHPFQLAVALPFVVGTHTTEVIDAFGELPVRATTARAGDLRVWAQTQLGKPKKVALSPAIELKVPLYANGQVGSPLPNFSDLFPKPGDGNVDITPWLYVGSGLTPKVFVEGGVGYIFRTEAFVGWETDIEFNDGPRFLAKIGGQLGPVLLIGGAEGQFVTSGQTSEGETDLFTRRFLVVFGNALIDVGKGIAIEPRIAVEAFAQNASQGWGGGLGVSWRN